MEDWETPLWHLIQTVDVDQEPWEQPDVMRQFDNLTPEQLDELVAFAKEEGAAIVIQYLPAAQFASRLGELLSGVMDYNWPGAWRKAQALSAIDAPLLPEIKKVFRTDKHNHLWLANIISGVIRPWPDELVRELQPELLEIAGYADADSAAINALIVLQRVLPPAEFEPLYQQARQQYAYDSSLQTELDEALGRP
jgi:hypothetical protein